MNTGLAKTVRTLAAALVIIPVGQVRSGFAAAQAITRGSVRSDRARHGYRHRQERGQF